MQYINRCYRRSGAPWEGRFRSCLAQSERYVLACYRYIELSPVRANMVSHPREHPWSSDRANAEGLVDALLKPHPEYLRMAGNESGRLRAYRELFTSHLDPQQIAEIRNATNGDYALGDERFRDEIARMLNRRVTPGRSGRPAQSGERC